MHYTLYLRPSCDYDTSKRELFSDLEASGAEFKLWDDNSKMEVAEKSLFGVRKKESSVLCKWNMERV